VRLFHFSIAYLFLLFGFLGADAALQAWAARGARPTAGIAVTVPGLVPVEAPTGDPVRVTFSALTVGNLPVRAEPLRAEILARRGEAATVDYRFRNTSTRSVDFQAIHRITPFEVDSLFKKQVCFCFERQTLAAGESTVLPVRFVLDRRLPAEITSVALGYSLVEMPAGR
jgi:cytochrome c oxidase assembly protein subunit 11